MIVSPFSLKRLILSIVLVSSLPSKALFDDEFDLDDSTEFDTYVLNDAISLPSKANGCFDSADKIASLLVSIGAPAILQQDFYLATYPLNQRSLLDYPLFLPKRIFYMNLPEYQTGFGVDFFWNKTNRMYFSRTSSNISSYLAINSPTLIDALTNSFNQVSASGVLPPGTTLEPARVLPLFRNATLEERRVGGMFHAEKQLQKVYLSAQIPLYYLERNFFLTQDERVATERVLGRLSDADQIDFQEKHMISDAFGLGDTRLIMDFQVRDPDIWGMNAGLFMTLPTAVAFKKGLMGSSFCTPACPPKIDFIDIFGKICDENTQQQGINEVGELGLRALDTLMATILESPLGNGGHVGLGGALITESHLQNIIDQNWAQNLHMQSRTSLEYLFQRYETRHFVPVSNTAEFDALKLNGDTNKINDKIASDPVYAAEVLALLERSLAQKLFPYAVDTLVQPKFIFRATSKLFYDQAPWYWELGTDFWVSGKEKITKIKPCPGVDVAFDFEKAQKPIAFQSKVFGMLSYTVERTNVDWILSLGADSTFASLGIGKDYSVVLGFKARF